MYDQESTSIAVTSILSWLRDVGILVALMAFGWKARGVLAYVENLVDDAKEFMRDSRLHMDTMEKFAEKMEENHVRHIEEYLYKIARDRNQVSLVAPEHIVAEHIQPPEVDDPNVSV